VNYFISCAAMTGKMKTPVVLVTEPPIYSWIYIHKIGVILRDIIDETETM
jgi:hypothetical protein